MTWVQVCDPKTTHLTGNANKQRSAGVQQPAETSVSPRSSPLDEEERGETDVFADPRRASVPCDSRKKKKNNNNNNNNNNKNNDNNHHYYYTIIIFCVSAHYDTEGTQRNMRGVQPIS